MSYSPFAQEVQGDAVITPPKFKRPILLTHPNIPKPLHGLNPRTVMGTEWWDTERHKAYARNNYCCWACGIHKLEADFRKHLEGHEAYNIDYPRGRADLKEIVALCHCCHSFIHCGLLWMRFLDKEVSYEQAHFILNRGYTILKEAMIKPHWHSYMIALEFRGISEKQALRMVRDEYPDMGVEDFAEWSTWRLVISGKEFPPVYKNMKEWAEAYKPKV